MSEAMNQETDASSSGFSFLAAAETNGEEPEASTGFSFISQVQPDQGDESYNENLPNASAFGFLQETPVTESSASGFGFLSSGNEPPLEEASAFGFLSSTNEPAPQVNPEGPNYSEPSSGFSFLTSAPPADPLPEPHSHTQAPLISQHSDHEVLQSQNAVQEIKLGKTASSKTVKKKKRAPKVGYARDEGEDDDGPSVTVNSVPSVDSEPTPSSQTSAPELSIPPRLEEITQNSLPSQIEVTSTPTTTADSGGVPSYILRKEEIMRKANGAPSPTKPEPQRRDSRTASDAPKMATPASAPEPSDHKATDGSGAKKQNSSGTGFMSFFSFSGKKDAAPPQQEKPVVPKANPSLHHAASNPTPQVQVVQSQPSVTVSAQHQQAPIQRTVPADPPPRPRVASNPPILPIEVQSQPPEQQPASATGADMFLGMSTTPSSITKTTPPPVRAEEPALPTVSIAPPVKSPQSPPSKKTLPVSPTKAAVVKLNNADVCEKIKLLSAEVVGGFHVHVTEQAQLQLQLVQKGRSLRVTMDSEEINGRRLQKLVEETEKEQLRLAEAEEFELADALSVKLEGYRAAVITSGESVTRLQQEIIQNDEELITLRNTQSSLFDSTVKGLSNLLRQQKEEIDKYLSANQSRLREDDTRISAEEERVQMERSGVAREESALEEEKNEIEGVINSQTSEIEKDREDLEMRLMGVTAEIKNLEKLLEQKRREEIELKGELGVVEEKIGVVRKKYDRRLQRIHDRVIDLTSDSEACRKEEEVIQEQRRLFLEDKSFVEKIEKDVDSWLLWMEGEIEITSKLKTALENIRDHDQQGASASAVTSSSVAGVGAAVVGDGHDQLVMLKEKVSLAENEVLAATAHVKSAQELVGQLMDEDAEIAEKLPQLEAEKKAHATNKRFKEAGNIAKTIKTLSTRKEEIAEQLQHSSSAIAEAENELENKKERYGEALKELKEAERSADIVRLDALRVQIKELRKANRKAAKEIEKLHPVATKLPTAATAAEESEILQLSQIALCFLQTELESAVSTANEIKEKHDLEVSLEEEEEEEEEEDKEETAEPVEELTEDLSSPTSASAETTDAAALNGGDKEDEAELQLSEELAPDVEGAEETDNEIPRCPEPHVEGATEEPSPVEGATVAESNRDDVLQEAHELMELISAKESELEIAVDEEDYDRAAELSETVDASKESLQSILLRLSMTREEVIANFSTASQEE